MSATKLTLKQTAVQHVNASKKIFQVTKMTGNRYFSEHISEIGILGKMHHFVAAYTSSFKLVLVYFDLFSRTFLYDVLTIESKQTTVCLKRFEKGYWFFGKCNQNVDLAN